LKDWRKMNSPLVLPQAAGADGCPAKPAKPRLPDGKAGAVLNTDALLDIFDGDRIAVAAVLRAAIISIKIDAQRVEAAVEARDPLLIRETAHRLKGTSGTLRAERLLRIASLIEDAPREHRIVEPSLLAELGRAVAILGVQIDAYCEANAVST
jgi:HPt (histidine-containing phosphotransfer) domain-containing protein